MRLDSMTSTEATPIPDVSNLPRDIDLLIPMIVQLADELTREREKRRLLQHEFDLLLKRLWGPKSEKVAAGQMALFDTVQDTGELAAIAAPPTAPAATDTAKPDEGSAKTCRKSTHGRRRCPDNLKRTVVIHDLTDAEKALLGGPESLEPLPDQVTTQYEWISSSLVVIEHRQKKYASRTVAKAAKVGEAQAVEEPRNLEVAASATSSATSQPASDTKAIGDVNAPSNPDVRNPATTPANAPVAEPPGKSTLLDSSTDHRHDMPSSPIAGPKQAISSAGDVGTSDASDHLSQCHGNPSDSLAAKSIANDGVVLEKGQTVESSGEEATQGLSEKTVVDLTATSSPATSSPATSLPATSLPATSSPANGKDASVEPAISNDAASEKKQSSGNSSLPASTAAAALRKRFELINEFRAMLEVDSAASDKRAAASRIIVAPKPPSAIPGGEAGPNLLSQTIISKYADHLPLYRLERIFGRHGVGFSRSTLCDWVSRCASIFQSLLAALREEVLKSFVIHTDDTPVDVRDSRAKEKYQARFWTYWGDNEHPFVWFDFTTNRKRQGPDAVLRAFRGYLQADGYGGYSGYEGVMLSDDTPILKVACWVHARRKFRDAMSSDPVRAALAISYIARLYEIEKMIKRELAQSEPTMSTEDQYRFIASRRQELAVPVLTEFRKWIDGPMPGVLPKSLLSKALVYVQNQWDALMRYVEDGRLQPDNNTAERALRGIALGRKAWLFCGSAIGGQTAATHFSLIASAVRNGLEPYQYLSCLLEELPLLGDKPTREQLLPYMPNVWRPYNGDSSL